MTEIPLTHPKIDIRPAEATDAGQYLHLVEALARYENMKPPDAAAKARLIEHLFGPKPRYGLLVAESGGHIVGYAAHFMAYSTFVAKPTFWLEDLYVIPEFRKHRVGHRLLATCARMAVAEGCGRFEFIVLDWNHLALAFYERHNIRARKDWLLHRAEGDEILALARSDQD